MLDICSYSQNFMVTIYDIDFCGNLKLNSILNYFQEVATRHATILKIDYHNLLKVNEFWVLSRTCAEIDHYPRLGDEITVVTYPINPRLVDCDRDYYVLDKNGEVLIRGVSKWLILDSNTHKIKRVNPKYFDGLSFFNKRSVNNPEWKVEQIENMQEVYKNKVSLDDIDFNRHMNNAKYANVVFNAFSPEDIINKKIKAFSINYLNEMRYEKDYTVKKFYKNDYDAIFEIDCENKPAFRAQIWFREK